PAAQFMYQDASGQRVTLYLKHMPEGRGQESQFRYEQAGKICVFTWIDDRVAYALAAEMPREQHLALAEVIYRQLNPCAPPQRGLSSRDMLMVARLLAAGLLVCLGSLAMAEDGGPSAAFLNWLERFKRDALGAGVQARTLQTALTGLAPIPRVI